ncbi:hypothetical protein LARI1_G007639, partial [Lachnellula arida]
RWDTLHSPHTIQTSKSLPQRHPTAKPAPSMGALAIDTPARAFARNSLFPRHLTPSYQRGLVCLLNASRIKCEYQWKQHVPLAKAAGVSEAQIAALSAAEISGPAWSEEDKALLRFLNAVIDGPEVSEPVFEKAREFFSDRVLVEVVTIQWFYYSLARIATVFRVDIENPSR